MFTITSRALLLLLVLVCGCKVGPKYYPPIVDTPMDWKNSEIISQAPIFEGFWWEVFQDEQLNCLEEQAIAANPNLFATLDRVAQARASAGEDGSALYPQITLHPNYLSAGLLFKNFTPNNGALLPAAIPTIFRTHILQNILPVNMSYELDLWGKSRGQYDSDIFNVQAQTENFQVALLTLTTDLASNYFKLRSYDTLIDVQEYNLSLLRKNFGLVESRYKKGLIGELDVVSAQQELTDNQAALEDTFRLRAIQENAIAVLLGVPASEFYLDMMPLVNEPPGVQPSLPSSVLLQRPDVRALERAMASQHALIGVAYASFFPAVELTGILGFLSPDLKHFLTWKSRLWLILANAAQVVFDGGLNEARLGLRYAQFHESLHNYQQKVLVVFQEVEDALVNIESQAREYELYMMSSGYAEKRTRLATTRYTKGLSNYLDVLDSERSKIQADTNRVNALGLRYLATIQLIKSLGGSWSFSLQTSFEEPGCGCESEEGYECHGPNIAEYDVCGHIF